MHKPFILYHLIVMSALKMRIFFILLNSSSLGKSNRAVLIHCCLNWVHLVSWRTSTMATSASRIRSNHTTIAYKLCKNWTIHSRHMFQMQHEITSLQSLPRHHQTSNCVNKSGGSILGLPYIRPRFILTFYSCDQWVTLIEACEYCCIVLWNQSSESRLSKDYRTF